ncbi:aspartate--tRNA ligase [Lactococcus nasutitermitis]|uniref:Aspartate--tRNA(Asp/Asn) ligase n=1 Tax=Lactococcus nasutitermitis TaxID=1652957 RepID=A0ABV9JEV4_9LACT|nr:aspartate--tRNA ligase [Lactococcus nasutitermitis]
MKTFIGRYGKEKVGQTVTAQGWVANIRNHGKIAFIELRDREGILQVVVNDKCPDFELLTDMTRETILAVTGEVVERVARYVNPHIKSGEVELFAEKIEVISRAKHLPFELDAHSEAGEEIRERYRYLDLRREKMTENLRLRHNVMAAVRNYLNGEEFFEIETPYLAKSTPEGARDFLVPSRLQQGEFYALPQSPQILKQLLMSAGFDRYYQMARCFRDEDLRGDRQPEFTQIDLEMSFVSQEEVQETVEQMVKHIVKKTKDVQCVAAGQYISDKTVKNVLDFETSFPQMSYDEAMRRFGSDKPDTRFGMELVDVTAALQAATSLTLKKWLADDGVIQAICAKGAAGKFSKHELEELQQLVKNFKVNFAVAPVENGAIAGNMATSFKVASDEILTALSATDGDVLFFVGGQKKRVQEALGALRVRVAPKLNLTDSSKLNFLWVTDFPLLEFDDTEKRYKAMHHPFTRASVSAEELEKSPETAKSFAYDLVLNGYEVGGGSLRIYQREMQEQMFALLGMEKANYERDFGFLLEAMDYGFPPHGGCALGLDRFVMLLAGEENIREVIAFPKNGTGRDLLLEAPAEVAPAQLRDLRLKNV